MKMKFSILLYLLPFTISAPPPTLLVPYVYLYGLPSELTHPLFEIPAFGLYIWRIPDLPEKPELMQWVPIFQNRINFKLLSNETYILLQVNANMTSQLYYWMGRSSTLVKRKITARFVVRTMHDLQSQIPGININYVSREQENLESTTFQNTFGITEVRPIIPRFYKLRDKNNDDFEIQALPLRYGELNIVDTFVLDEITHVKIWSASSLNTKMRTIALAFASYIHDADRIAPERNQDIRILYGSENDFPTFQKEFLRNLDGRPKNNFQFPVQPLYKIKEKKLRLFEYFYIVDHVSWREIVDRPVTLKHFYPDKAYIVTDELVHNIFVLIGMFSHATIIEEAMAYAERLYWDISPHIKWKKITVIRKGEFFPTPFIVNFDEFKSILKEYIEKLN